ncbi:hypothetical protein Tco_0126923, partial [Tanacetum coccineum]
WIEDEIGDVMALDLSRWDLRLVLLDLLL